ncbi:uncharacterized protein [Nicotiana tomentosiformis]|uniref:uncharacterized protein n=1 Tax=Nicotiana tomentosiformis TaxID=4098 RepID=UPI00388CAE97
MSLGFDVFGSKNMSSGSSSVMITLEPLMGSSDYLAWTSLSSCGVKVKSSTLGPWVMDSGTSDYIYGNKSLLSNIVYSQSLPTVTLANGCQTKAKRVGQANPLSSIILDSVLYVHGYPFSLASVSRLTRALHCGEALSHPGWRHAIRDEMSALHISGIWELVPLPSCKSTVGCRWDYAVKVRPDGQIDRLKTRLIAKGYTQIFGLDYSDIFSSVGKVASIRLFLFMIAVRHWPIYQLDIKNAFFYGDLEDEVYIEQLPGFVAQVVCIIQYIKSASCKGLLFDDRGHEQIVRYSDVDWAGSPSDRRSTSGYCVLVGGILVSWKSKKQNVVARSSAEAEYQAMAMVTCELVWTKQLLKELKFGEISRMELVCDN